MTNRLFREVDTDEIAHTAYSAVLVTDEHLRATVQYTTDEVFPTSAKLVEAHEKWMVRSEKNKTAFQVAWNTDLPQREYLEQKGLEDRLKAYTKAQEVIDTSLPYDMDHTITTYEWSKVRRLVCIGGASSPTATILARHFPNLRIMVEDLPDIAQKAQEQLPGELERKLYFTAHDYTSPNPQPDEVSGADVYLLRDVLSHHSDEYATKTLEGLVELLQDGAKLLILDTVVPVAGSLAVEEEKELGARDLDSMMTENGKLRTLDDWEKLLHQADADLVISSVTQPEGSAWSALEVVLEVRDE